MDRNASSAFILAAKAACVAALLLLLAAGGLAQTAPKAGREFWIAFQPNRDREAQNRPRLLLTLQGPRNAACRVRIAGTDWSRDFMALGGATTRFEIPYDEALPRNQTPRAVHLTASDSVQVDAHHLLAFSSEAASVLPLHALGGDHLYLGWLDPDDPQLTSRLSDQLTVVATEDGTEVEIIPATRLRDGSAAGVPLRRTLNRGQTWFINAEEDLSGTRVRALGGGACPRLAVFGGASWTWVGGCHNGDHLYEQVPPVRLWGREYLGLPVPGRAGFWLRVAALEAAELRVNNGPPIALAAGVPQLVRATAATHLACTRPLVAAQLTLGSMCDDADAGDPALVYLPPLNLAAASRLRFAALDDENLTVRSLQLAAPAAAVPAIRLEGDVRTSGWTPLPNGWFGQSVQIASGGAQIIASAPVLGYYYEMGRQDACAIAPLHGLRPPLPVVRLPESACPDAAFRAALAGEYLPDRVRWHVNESFVSGENEPQISISSKGRQRVWAALEYLDGCYRDTVSAEIEISGPALSLAASANPSCAGRADGSIDLRIEGGQPPYRVEGFSRQPDENGRLASLPAGAYQLQVVDGRGCRSETLRVALLDPEPVVFAVDSANGPRCYGASDGVLFLRNLTGYPELEYSVDGGPWRRGPQIGPLRGGRHSVQARNAAGCVSEVMLAELLEPAPIAARWEIDSVRCPGESDGSIRLEVSGGQPPYRYSLTGRTVGAVASEAAQAEFDDLRADFYDLTVYDLRRCSHEAFGLKVAEPAPLVLRVKEIIRPKCAGESNGIVVLEADGGTPPYRFIDRENREQGSGRMVGLAAGRHAFTVRDARGCEQIIETEVPSQSGLRISRAETADALCQEVADGSLRVAAEGGTPPYRWFLNDTLVELLQNRIDGLGAGEYQLALEDANGCRTEMGGLRIGLRLQELVLNVEAKQPLCPEGRTGELRLTGDGGRPPYRYWMNGQEVGGYTWMTGLPAGNYRLTMREQRGCTVDTLFRLEARAGLFLNSARTWPATCYDKADGGMELDIESLAPPLRFYLNNREREDGPRFEGLTVGDYTWQARDATGCVLTGAFKIEAPPALIWLAAQALPPRCPDSEDGSIEVKVRGGVPEYAYYLYKDSAMIAESVNGVFELLEGGNYAVTARDASGCELRRVFELRHPEPLQLSPETRPPSCAGALDGQIRFRPTGGTPPLSVQSPENADWTGFAYSGLAAGSYLFRVTDAQGCTMESIVELSPGPEVDAGPEIIVCLLRSGDRFQRTLLTNAKPAGGRWSGRGVSGDGVLSVDRLIEPHVRMLYYQYGACVDSTPARIVRIVMQDTLTACKNAGSVLLPRATPTGGTWYPGDGLLVVQNRLHLQRWRADSSWVAYVSPEGCRDSLRLFRLEALPPTVEIKPEPEPAEPLPTLMLRLAEPDVKVKVETRGLREWRWHFGEQNYSREEQLTWRYRRTGQFPLELAYQTRNGCRDTLRWRVRVLPSGSVDLPDAFSPNGDGNNDEWTFEILETDVCHLQIFDRWGTRIFDQRAKIPRWDGRHSDGSPMPEGVYAYLIEVRLLNGDVIRQGGTVTIVR